MATALTERPSIGSRRLELRLDPDRPVSEAECWNPCRENADWDLQRSADGIEAIIAPAGDESERRGTELLFQLMAWNQPQPIGECVVRLAWLIDPKQMIVEVHRPDREVEVLTRPSELSGSDVLPGFTALMKGILGD